MTDMEDHGPNWDEDTVHIEVEDELRRSRLDPDDGASVWKGYNTSTEA